MIEREPHKRRRDTDTRWPKGRGRPFRDRERRLSRKRAGRLRYDPQCDGGPSGVIRAPVVPFVWRGIEDRSRRACVGVGSGLVQQCLRRPSVGEPLRGDEESGEPNADNGLNALGRGWRRGRATYIANRCSTYLTFYQSALGLSFPTPRVGMLGCLKPCIHLAATLPIELKQSKEEMAMRYPAYREVQIGEPDANSEFFASLRTRKRAVFLDSFFTMPNLPLSDFETGAKYLIYGQKGIGKTSVLRYLQDSAGDASVEFIIFKKALLEEIDLADFSKIPLMVDEQEIQRFRHYHHLLKRMLIFILVSKLSNVSFVDDGISGVDDEPTRSLLTRIFGAGATDALKLAVDSASDVFNSLGVDLRKTTSDRVLLEGTRLLKRTNDSLLKYLVHRAKTNSKRIRVYVDEIHFAYRSEDSLQQDAMLVRDTILAVQSLNDRFAEEQVDIILYVAVRSEYLEHPIISTADINHAVESVGFELTYSNFPPTRSHPLFDLMYLRFRDAIGEGFDKDTFFVVYLSSIEADKFLKRTWSKPRDMIRFFSCAKKLYPNRSSLSMAEQNTVWRNYSQEAWKEIKSAASPFLPPPAISKFEETMRG